jgi:hypothetical protein
MGAILRGTMRSPFTGIVFALELTHDFNMLLPLLVACFLAYLFTVLTLKRSILTEKISRRGYHLSREYALDPLEILFVREVMRTNVVVLPRDGTLEEAYHLIHSTDNPKGQHLFPVLGSGNELAGVVTRNQLVQRYQSMLDRGCWGQAFRNCDEESPGGLLGRTSPHGRQSNGRVGLHALSCPRPAGQREDRRHGGTQRSAARQNQKP